jgi:hypothetical protein
MANWPTPRLSPGSVRRIAISLWQRCAPTRHGHATGRDLPRTRPWIMTKTILAEAVTRRSAVQKMTGALGQLSQAHGEACLGSPIVPKGIEAGRTRKLSCAHKSKSMLGGLRKSPSSMSHRRKSFCFILSLPLLLSKSPRHARESVGRRNPLNYRWTVSACEPFTAGAGVFSTDR